ncbi:alkaline phosphatase D family protein [Tropicimonas sp. TH_r6]|uniref:alkaline phosphatase D family protein n=1 Tax=Tropicimonas sp. TH_r6 TaxID=3082085 RepID=UPI0029530FB1|nr:alkaline phosphatase D family protein [Tropicimonas sp. TH_r6]MDV7145339.1 alkaline phosphatase D family protein [Tropicimonas sp. TH_r6]
MPAPVTGPVLFLDEIRDGQLHLAALFLVEEGHPCPPIETTDGVHAPEPLADYGSVTALRVRFTLPCARSASYRWNGIDHDLAGLTGGDLRLAYVSCNGEEVGDLERAGSERNIMWARLSHEQDRAPFALLLHGGDQVYADEVTKGHPLSEGWPEKLPVDPSPEAMAGLRAHLRLGFMERYRTLYSAPEFARLAARVPSLMQWDDHDICDGWGSLPEETLQSPVGRALFETAREAFLVFQQAACDGDLPARFTDPKGQHLGWSIQSEGLRILAPDLRSERTRHAIMGTGSWEMMEAQAEMPAPGRTLLMSSVPLLGPRLSILESVMLAIPRMQKYEDDLRDQWQSHAHREEWIRMLSLVCGMAEGSDRDVTVLSGEIHLATRAMMDLGPHGKLHQLVASGISHRAPPRSWALLLGLLARAGEDPLPEHPIRIARIPGQSGRYVAERNYLVLERVGSAWQAVWEFETSGRSAPLPLD